MNQDANDLWEVKISSHQQLSLSSGLIRFKRSFSFKAGQVINITNNKNLHPRMYSIASSESEDQVEILYKEVPDGLLTPHFKHLQKGDILLISRPFGKYTASSEPAVFIATGTGIAPFISMIRSGNIENKTIIHGSRKLDEFYYSHFIQKTLGDKYICCYTGNEKSPLFQGRVNAYLEQHKKLQTNIKYYLCGSSEMVVDTRQILINKDIPFQNIHAEIYF